MRRSRLVVAVLALSLTSVLTSSASGQSPRDERRGLIFDGLRQRPGGPCGSAFEISATVANARPRCTHGPDPAPDGLDVRQRRSMAPMSSKDSNFAASQPDVPCFGTGTDGYRVQLLYVRLSGTTNRLSTLYPSFVAWTGNTNTVFDASASKTGGVRHVRFVTDSNCDLVITAVEVSAAAINDFGTFIQELNNAGFDRSDRRYLSWVDANIYCGIGEIYLDDTHNPTPGLISSNANNGHPLVAGLMARVDNGCWGQANSVEAHELVHTFGGVQPSAPHATSGLHCTDDKDRMCYLDGSPPNVLFQVCTGATDENRLDCNNDDYFHTAPGSGYLTTHWNVANSAFLSTSAPQGDVVVVLAGAGTTQDVMGSIAELFNGSMVQINGTPTPVEVFNLPMAP